MHIISVFDSKDLFNLDDKFIFEINIKKRKVKIKRISSCDIAVYQLIKLQTWEIYHDAFK